MGTSAKRSAVRIAHEQDVVARMRGTQDRIADAITTFAGTMAFVYLHALWFTVWIVCNEGVFGEAAVWDPYPFGLLTMIVSLEAIFLSTFVMVSQNRQAARENVRADLDFETNVRSEVWAVHMGQALGVDPVEVERRVQELLAENRARMNGSGGAPR
ncbi:DUF1003 domain-containing protein [Streptomyces sp. NPDC002623]